MAHLVRALTVLLAGSLILAPQAAADQDEYLRKLQDRLPFLSAEQLLSEGTRICNATRKGTPASDVVIMVRDDLGLSISAAGNVVSTAVVELGC